MITIFPHIRWTGGSTLRLLMDHQFPGRTARCGFEYGPRLGDVVKVAGAKLMDAWYGHHPYGLHKHLDGPCQYITLLRNPLDRIVSIWQRRILRYPETTLLDVANGIAGKRVETDTINMATRILAGGMKRWDEDIGEVELERAKENLSTFAVVGFTNEYKSFTTRLRDNLGWKTVDPENLPRENAGPKKVKVPLEQVNTLSGCPSIALDIELYLWAQINC